MKTNVPASERTARLAIALGAGVAVAFAPNAFLRGLLVASATAMLASVVTGFCPINAALADGDAEDPQWRTLRIHRVEA